MKNKKIVLIIKISVLMLAFLLALFIPLIMAFLWALIVPLYFCYLAIIDYRKEQKKCS